MYIQCILKSLFNDPIFPVVLLFSPLIPISTRAIRKFNGTSKLISKLPLERIIIHRSRYIKDNNYKEGGLGKRTRVPAPESWLLLLTYRVRNFRGVNSRSFFTLRFGTPEQFTTFSFEGGVISSTHMQPEDYFYFKRYIIYYIRQFAILFSFWLKSNTLLLYIRYIYLPHEKYKITLKKKHTGKFFEQS